MSQSEWPSDQFWAILAEKYNVKYKDHFVTYKEATTMELDESVKFMTKNLKHFVQQNFISVTIYFGSFDVQTIEEIPIYSFWGFLSTLGGALSLFLGLTFIQMFEVLEFLVKLLVSLLNKGK